MEISRLHSEFVRKPAARAMLGGISNATLHRWVKSGRLPQLVSIGPRCSGFVRVELEAAIDAIIANRRTA